MSDLVRNIIRFCLFLAVQVFILNKIPHLHRLITPYIYFLFILWLPFSTTRFWLMVIAFLFGLSLDYFTMTPGLHAAVCVLIAYVRPFIIGILTPKESSEFNYREPSPRAMGWTPYSVYALFLTLVHHIYLVFLEWLQFGNVFDFILKVIGSTGISMVLIFIVELIFPRKLKFRTNVA
jgi:cell shape-determining protein MreD